MTLGPRRNPHGHNRWSRLAAADAACTTPWRSGRAAGSRWTAVRAGTLGVQTLLFGTLMVDGSGQGAQEEL